MRFYFYNTSLLQLVASSILASGALAQTTSTLRPLELNDKAPSSYLVEDIQVTGTQSLDEEAIVNLSGLKPGVTLQIPGPAITDAIQRLWKQNLVKDVAIYASQVTDQRVVLTVSITESPRLSDYSFEGIKRREQKKLIDKIALVRGKIITDELIKNTQKILQDYWLEKGYLHTVVTITSLPDPAHPDHIQLKIKIDKGERICINAVHFEGNQHISSDVLRGQMQHIRERPRFTLVKDILEQVFTLQPIRKEGILWRSLNLKESWDYLRKHVIIFSSKLNQAKLEEDKKYIIDYYQSQGFRDAAIVESGFYKHEDTSLDVWMKVEEGMQYHIGNIRWVGNYIYDDDTLNQILNIRKGDVYNPLLLQQKLYNDPEGPNIASLYMDDGYLFFQADPVEVGLEGNIVDLEIRIYEGPQTHIKRVLIEGNTLTHDYVIRRELRTLSGDKFNRAKLQRSYRELAHLNLFDPAIDIVPMPNFVDETVDIKYKIKERPNAQINFSGGWGGGFMAAMALSTNHFSLGNLFKSRLPFGGGQTLGLRAEVYYQKAQNIVLQFTEPWLGGKKPRYFHLSLNRVREYNRTSIGGNISLGTKLAWPDDYMLLRGSLDYHCHDYKNYELLDDKKKLTGTLNDFSFSILLERDSTGPSVIYPKEGSKLSLRTHLTPPWSWFSQANRGHAALEEYPWKEYHQWMLDGSYFLRLLDDLVLNMRGHFGVLGNFSSQKRIGPFSRFVLGGPKLSYEALNVVGEEYIALRGYEEDYIKPKDQVSGYKGGVIYDKFMLELRYPIISSYLASAYVLAFAEAGNTWTQYEDFSLFSLKRSGGVGLRFYLPLLIGATVGLDWGYGFDKLSAHKGNNELMFHFSIGTH